ncbi:MAG: type II toxin-antitoxin system Phd/YefM family antitoxin [Candidatus Anammoxibacter sp.]
MLKTITAMQARQKFGELMNEVSIRHDEYIVERAGKPLVAIIPISEHKKIQK